ncbi:hypothetical protein AGR6A_Lc40025 [Agrobacterium sp. NCPPB 925]|nr:hypothetical protein AGR6A_Lc40025 [Agrobacterium sp. NCPPB 925]
MSMISILKSSAQFLRRRDSGATPASLSSEAYYFYDFPELSSIALTGDPEGVDRVYIDPNIPLEKSFQHTDKY